MSNLLKEAIADADAVKKAALKNAKMAIEEAFTPTLRGMISNKLAEDDGDNDEDDLEASTEEIPAEVPSEDPAPADPVEPDFPTDEPVDPESNDELDEILRELDGMDDDTEDDMFAEDDGYDDEFTDGGTEDDLFEDEDFDTEDDYSDDDMELESLIRELEGDDDFGMEDEMTEGEEEDYLDDPAIRGSDLRDPHNESRRRTNRKPLRTTSNSRKTPLQLQSENKKLKSNLNEAMKAVGYLKKTLNEVALLNAKLLYSGKILRSENLKKEEQIKILNQFDRATNKREVQLVYTSLAEAFKNKKLQNRNRVNENASKSQLVLKPVTEGFSFSPRMQELAGIIKKK